MHEEAFDYPEGQFDLLGSVVLIVRESIEAGLITSTDLTEFDEQIELLEGNELEDYLQDLWDNL